MGQQQIDRILQFLIDSYLSTLDQVSLLYFRGRRRTLAEFSQYQKTAYNHLLNLVHKGLVGRNECATKQLGRHPYYFITTKGLKMMGYERSDYGHYHRAARRLADHGSRNASHAITVTQVCVDLRLLTCWIPPLNLCYWQSGRQVGDAFSIEETMLAGFSHRKVLLRPDAVGTLLFDEEPYRFLLEVDMGTMSGKQLEKKFGEYKSVFERQCFQDLWGYHEPPTVLFITTSRRSLRGVVEAFNRVAWPPEENLEWDERAEQTGFASRWRFTAAELADLGFYQMSPGS
jgi:hypothetical protein